MAIMQRCCWFPNVRSGSRACGIYSLTTSCIYLLNWSINLALRVSEFTSKGITRPEVDGIYAAFSIDIIVTAFLLIPSIVLLVGVAQDNRTMLIPYMVAIMTLMVLQANAWIILFVSFVSAEFETGLLIVNFVFWLLFTALNITCLICVISQYQELRDGRGKASDVE